jgi:signal peptidase II
VDLGKGWLVPRLVLFVILAVAGGGIDLWTKHAVFAWRGNPGDLPPYWIVEPYVGIETAVNMGALFGMGQGYGWLFSALSIAAAIGIVVWLFVFGAAKSKWLTTSMGLILGGIVGNLYDRLAIPALPESMRGGVRDWVLFRYESYVWPNFNIADSVLVAGAIMLAIHSFLFAPQQNNASAPSPAASAGE